MNKAISMVNINKSFSGVRVLKDVNLHLRPGTVNALMGENGAGKSTLMKILNGIYTMDSGEIFVDGEKVEINSVRDAIENGISMIPQEISAVEEMTVAQNIFLGREPVTKLGILDDRAMVKQTKKLLKDMDVDLDAKAYMKDLSIAQIQMVEILKAVSYEAKVIIMDEPTSALAEHEVNVLFNIIEKLKKDNKSIIYISHKLEEIFRIAEDITILRDGEYIMTEETKNLDHDRLISAMVGRELKDIYPKDSKPMDEVKMKVRNLTKAGVFEDISFDLYKGEILGLAGLVGAGRSEVVEAIYGYNPYDSGTIEIDGKPVEINKPQDGINQNIALVSEDRKRVGLNLDGNIKENITLANLDEYCKFKTVLDDKKERKIARESIKKFNIKAKNEDVETIYLSGGNQQKVILAKCISCNPDILIMDEPTKGIDIGAKSEIYKLMNDFVKEGNSIIMVSSEMPEAIGMSDRLLVLHEGKIKGEYNRGEFDQEKIMASASGHGKEDK